MKYLKMFKKLQYYFKHQEDVNYKVSDAILTIVFGAFSDKEKLKWSAWIYAVRKHVPRQLTITESIKSKKKQPDKSKKRKYQRDALI